MQQVIDLIQEMQFDGSSSVVLESQAKQTIDENAGQSENRGPGQRTDAGTPAAQEWIERRDEEQEGFLVPCSQRHDGNDPTPIEPERHPDYEGKKRQFRIIVEESAPGEEIRQQQNHGDGGKSGSWGRVSGGLARSEEH